MGSLVLGIKRVMLVALHVALAKARGLSLTMYLLMVFDDVMAG